MINLSAMKCGFWTRLPESSPPPALKAKQNKPKKAIGDLLTTKTKRRHRNDSRFFVPANKDVVRPILGFILYPTLNCILCVHPPKRRESKANVENIKLLWPFARVASFLN